MNEHDRFSVPHEIDEILERLPPQVTLNIPDHILSLWFPPGPANGVMEGRALTRAQSLRARLRLPVRVSRRPRCGRLLQGDTVGRLNRQTIGSAVRLASSSVPSQMGRWSACGEAGPCGPCAPPQ